MSVHFMIDEATGDIKQWYSGADISIQPDKPGCSWITADSTFNPSIHRRVDLTTGDLLPAADPDPPTLSELKEAAALIVSRKRQTVIDGGMTFNGVRFQTRADDRENIAGATQLASLAVMAGAQPNDLRWHGGATDFVWIAEDNSLIPMDAPTVIAFGKTAAEFKKVAIFKARALKNTIDAAADATALAAIDLDSGWA